VSELSASPTGASPLSSGPAAPRTH
jgi:hypothetical protein